MTMRRKRSFYEERGRRRVVIIDPQQRATPRDRASKFLYREDLPWGLKEHPLFLIISVANPKGEKGERVPP